MPIRPNGSSLPTVSSHRFSGVTLSCSSVPSSFSRTMAIDPRTVVMTISSSASTPGTMKCGLEQLRVEPDADARVDRSDAPARRPAGAPAAMSAAALGEQRLSRSRGRGRGVRVGAVGDDLHRHRRERSESSSPYPGGIDSAIHARRVSMSRRTSRRLEVTWTTLKYGEPSKRPIEVAAHGRCGRASTTTIGTFFTSVVAA